jgi:hypothetical protein
MEEEIICILHQIKEDEMGCTYGMNRGDKI